MSCLCRSWLVVLSPKWLIASMTTEDQSTRSPSCSLAQMDQLLTLAGMKGSSRPSRLMMVLSNALSP